jgi:peptidoglycan/LPS O-acetylase OafA/YrhL
MTLKSGTSTYLDLLRISAALMVFISHLSWNLISGGFLWPLQFIGHDGVIVFFVLSGFVISHAAATHEKSFLHFQVARFGRLYSVVVPALVLTFLFDQIGLAQDPSKYMLARESEPLLRLLASGLFLSQSWGWDLYTLGNDPFWSLPYEFWYYQLFAAATFLSGWKLALLIVLCAGLSGPPILIFLPLWLMGVAAYRIAEGMLLTPERARKIFVLSGACCLFLILMGRWVPTRNTPLLPPNFSLLDFVLGAAVALNIFSARAMDFRFGPLARPIAGAAGISFALYLLHMPLLRMLSAFTPAGWAVLARGLVLAVLVLVTVYLLSFVTEGRKKEWRVFFQWLFSRFKRDLSPG